MAKKKRADRDASKRRTEYLTRRKRLERQRNVIGLLAVVPLLFSVVCGTGTPLDALCFIPRDIWLFVWAALFGSFLGLTIRLILERRRFERGERGKAQGEGPLFSERSERE
jgi:hypothetical protein